VGGRDILLSQTYSRQVSSHTANLIRPNIKQNIIIMCTALIGACTYVIIARILGPLTFGNYLFAQWLATVTVPMIGTGMSTLASRQLAATQSRESPRLIAGIFYFLWYRQHRSMLLYFLFSCMLAFTFSRIFYSFSPGLLLLTSLATLPLLLSSVAGTTLRSLRRADLLTILHLFGTLLTLLFVLIATQINGRPVEAFILVFALSNTLTLILAVICVIHLLPLEQALAPGIFLKERLIKNLNLSWLHFTLDAIVWQRSELLLLACWHNSTEVGFYALSALISTRTIGIAPSLFSQWIFPLALRCLPGHRYLDPYDAFVKTSCYIIFLAVPICATAIIFCHTLILFILGPAYLPIVQPLRILLIAAVFGSIATVSLTHLANYERGTQQNIQKLQNRCNVGVAILKIVLAVPLVWFWGIMGASIASAVAQIVSALVSILLCKNILKRHDTFL
jgi:O-antigen/teichoic acid export membrane protein